VRSVALGLGLGLALAIASVQAAPPERMVWVSRRGEVVYIRAAGLEFISGQPLARLKDGRTIRLDLDAALGPAASGPFVAIAQPRFVLSYDLWEERFAVTRTDIPRSISHLTARDAEAWCLEQLAVPFSVFHTRSADMPFRVRLEYRLQDEELQPSADDRGITLRGLIDRLSRRQSSNAWMNIVVSGPLRLQ
jgi:hypothetical protein